MPLYEYYCKTCGDTFEKLRPVQAATATAECPSGHDGATRTLTLFATVGKATEQVSGMGGGCCGGGGCACGASRN